MFPAVLRSQSSLPHLGIAGLCSTDSSQVVLLLSDLLGQFDSGDHHACVLKGLNPKHGLNSVLHSPVVLFDNVIQVFNPNIRQSSLVAADLTSANLSLTILSGSNLRNSMLGWATLCGAKLRGADLRMADLSRAKLCNADLSKANLGGAILNYANLENADITGCRAFGISAWNVRLSGSIQENITITPANESAIQVDRLEIAQFIYLLPNNAEIRHVIDTITSKAVLILGRFTDERKAVLDGIREELRKQNYVPILFDLDKPRSRDTHETITTLARLARFVISDITYPKSIPQELVSIVEQLPSLAVKPILLKGAEP